MRFFDLILCHLFEGNVIILVTARLFLFAGWISLIVNNSNFFWVVNYDWYGCNCRAFVFFKLTLSKLFILLLKSYIKFRVKLSVKSGNLFSFLACFLVFKIFRFFHFNLYMHILHFVLRSINSRSICFGTFCWQFFLWIVVLHETLRRRCC